MNADEDECALILLEALMEHPGGRKRRRAYSGESFVRIDVLEKFRDDATFTKYFNFSRSEFTDLLHELREYFPTDEFSTPNRIKYTLR